MPSNQHFPDKSTTDELTASEFNTVKNESVHGYNGRVRNLTSPDSVDGDFPSGWSASRSSSPYEYTVTHNLGTLGYSVTVTLVHETGGVYGGPGTCTVERNSNTFVVRTFDTSGTTKRAGFYFQVNMT